jgi:hypothetical protein
MTKLRFSGVKREASGTSGRDRAAHGKEWQIQRTDLIKSKPLAARVPGEGPEKGVQLLRGISESSEILAQDDDHVGTKSFRF